MISITLEQLINSTDGLKGLSQKQLKARSAYAVSKILKAADAEMNTFNETRMELIKKYGEKDETGELKSDEQGNVHIIDEMLSTFNKELQELLNTTVDINANKIKIEDIGDVEFTPAEMAQLDDFIEFDEE
jgi:hypothetical protein